MVKTKRIYEDPEPEDGSRYLVDRLWPRGVSKDKARIDQWLKDIAPSDALRKWFAHEMERWGEFKRRYKLELQDHRKQEILDDLAREAENGTLTLVYAARDEERNNAVALKEAVDRKLEGRGS